MTIPWHGGQKEKQRGVQALTRWFLFIAGAGGPGEGQSKLRKKFNYFSPDQLQIAVISWKFARTSTHLLTEPSEECNLDGVKVTTEGATGTL